MTEELQLKIKEYFSQMAILRNQVSAGSLFAGRNLPSFVMDFVTKRYLNLMGEIDGQALSQFLDTVIPKKATSVKDRLGSGQEVMLMTRFNVYIDLIKNVRRFGIPDLGIKLKEGIIPPYIFEKHKGELVDGEMWGIIKLCLLPDDDGKKNHVEMVDFHPFKPYRSVDISYLREARKAFTLNEWIDVMLSAMGYEPTGFGGLTKKLEFLTRLLIFVEPRLNVIELAPKGTGKSYVFGNISKYCWIVSGGKVTRAKLFYDKQKDQYGIIKNHDFTVFDEIQTIVFQEPAEIQAALKSYLESGKTTIDDKEFTSECGLMLMGNIPLTADYRPVNTCYFDSLPKNFRESALLDRFHCFIEGWYLPRINKGMIYNGWTINIEYFSEILHSMRIENVYNQLFDDLVEFEHNADMRDFKAVKKITVGYMKLLFPHWTKVEDVDKQQFNDYCLEPAIHRRGIIKQQCHYIDPEFKTAMPDIHVK
ncbi:BREX system Lon protease-like protein BrxL [Prevotella fusca]